MSYQEVLGQQAIAISVSDSPDMTGLGLDDEHLRDAMTEIARHLLALGARLIYGGDLRQYGFSELLFELVARHRRDADEGDHRNGISNYLAWPIHILTSIPDLEAKIADLTGLADLVLLKLDGSRLSMDERRALTVSTPNESDWSEGLTAMRQTMLVETSARIVLGGRLEGYKGAMPGIAEEALLSIRAKQPLYILGGFGGCARDIGETLGLISRPNTQHREWSGRMDFFGYSAIDLNNGLTQEENMILAHTSHVDQAVALTLRGLSNVLGAKSIKLSLNDKAHHIP